MYITVQKNPNPMATTTDGKITIRYELRMKHDIKTSSGFFKKGGLIKAMNEVEFRHLDISKPLAVCVGHGVYEYFSYDDVECFQVTTTTTVKSKLIKL